MSPEGRRIRKLLVVAALLFPLGIGLVLTGYSLGALLVPLCADGKSESTPELSRRCAQPRWWIGAGLVAGTTSVSAALAAMVLWTRGRRRR